MARPEKVLDPRQGPVQQFASNLRQLRYRAGAPTYREMARRAHYSVTTLSDAARGERAPTLDATLAYVGACSGDQREWTARWRDLQRQITPAAPQQAPVEPVLGGWRRRITGFAASAGLLAAAVLILTWRRRPSSEGRAQVASS